MVMVFKMFIRKKLVSGKVYYQIVVMMVVIELQNLDIGILIRSKSFDLCAENIIS